MSYAAVVFRCKARTGRTAYSQAMTDFVGEHLRGPSFQDTDLSGSRFRAASAILDRLRDQTVARARELTPVDLTALRDHDYGEKP